MKNLPRLVVQCLLVLCLFACSGGGSVEAGEASPEAGETSSTTTETAAAQSERKAPEDLHERMSYAIGLNVGRTLRNQGIKANVELLLQGVQDGVSSTEALLSDAQVQNTMKEFQNYMLEAKKTEGEDYLNANREEEGVVVLPSGLQYQVLQAGTGAQPGADDQVKVHYRGTFINGEQFDSSYDRGEPATFGVTQVIRGWTEALQLMKEGAKWKLAIPSDLAYGVQGRPGIPPNSTLVFEVELLEIVKK